MSVLERKITVADVMNYITHHYPKAFCPKVSKFEGSIPKYYAIFGYSPEDLGAIDSEKLNFENCEKVSNGHTGNRIMITVIFSEEFLLNEICGQC